MPPVDGVDEHLYERAAGGDAASLDQLLARYLPQLHAYVHTRMGESLRVRESSLDVVQSVCRELLADRAAFEFRGEERFRAWLFTAALNKIRAKSRFHSSACRAPERETAPGTEAILASSFLTPSRDAAAAEQTQALQAALAALPEDYREVITLARIVSLPHSVIAELTGRSEEAVRQLLVRALVRLTKELRARGVTEQ